MQELVVDHILDNFMKRWVVRKLNGRFHIVKH